MHNAISDDLKTIFSGIMASVNELAQMFPKLDSDLSSVGDHFTFDNIGDRDTGNLADAAGSVTPQPLTEEKTIPVVEIIEIPSSDQVSYFDSIDPYQF